MVDAYGMEESMAYGTWILQIKSIKDYNIMKDGRGKFVTTRNRKIHLNFSPIIIRLDIYIANCPHYKLNN